MIRFPVTGAILFFIYLTSFGQAPVRIEEPDYGQIFGDNYAEAKNYLNHQEWIDSIVAQGISPVFAKAIVFPEVIRYSAIRDKLELQALFTLYVQYGEKYSNFSVGRFQMKPSFARQVELDAKKLEDNSAKALNSIDTADTPEARLARVKRLESQEWQMHYLIWFVKIMDRLYGEIYDTNSSEKLRFYATAYNCGYKNSAQVIFRQLKKCCFHTSLFSSEKRYCYGDIASAYYNSNLP